MPRFKAITKDQIKTIHTLKGKLGMADESYVALISRIGLGVMTSKDLSSRQATAVISEMEYKLGERPAPRPSKPKVKPATPSKSGGNVIALATPGQQQLISDLVCEVNWHQHGGFAPWLAKMFKLDAVRTKEDAQKVINGLKGLKQHGHAKKGSRYRR